MPNKKLWDLPRADAITGNEVVPLTTAAANTAADLNFISAWFNAKPTAYNFGALSVEPTVSPFDGGPIPLGAQYYNSTTNELRSYGAFGWFTPNIDALLLAAPTGATLVGTPTGTVQAAIDARPTSVALAASGGAGLVGFLQSGTGAVARKVEDKEWERVSFMDYMSVAQISDTQAASQALDLSVALQNAINAVKSTRGKTIGSTQVRTGGREIELAPGVYQYGTTLLMDGDISLVCRGGAGSALLHYTGVGDAIVVNNTDMTITAPQNTRVFRMDGVTLYPPAAARGIVFGGATQRHVELLHGQIIGCPGRAIDCGAGVYFLRLGNFEIRNGGEGAFVGEYCDLFTADDRCFFTGNTGPDLILECPTFRIDNCDFEGANGSTAHIRIQQTVRTPAVAAVRAGLILGNRFGPEGTNPADYDIELIDNGAVTSAEVTTDLKIWGNVHFSPSGAAAKISPIRINSKTKRLDVRGNRYSANYSAGAYITSTDTTAAYATGYTADSFIDVLADARSEIRGIFQATGAPGFTRFWTANTSVTAFSVVRKVGNYSGADRATNNAYTVAALTASVTGNLHEDAVGIATYSETTAARPVWIATDGALITTTLDTTGSAFGAPVYLQAAGGLGLTASTFPLVVGRVMSVGANATIQVSIENKRATLVAVNVDATARGFDRQEIIYNSAITADRTVTLNATTPSIGDRLRVTRTAAATGAFNVIVNGRNLAANTFVDLEYTSSGWLFTASGAA